MGSGHQPGILTFLILLWVLMLLASAGIPAESNRVDIIYNTEIPDAGGNYQEVNYETLSSEDQGIIQHAQATGNAEKINPSDETVFNHTDRTIVIENQAEEDIYLTLESQIDGYRYASGALMLIVTISSLLYWKRTDMALVSGFFIFTSLTIPTVIYYVYVLS